jgi:hypothetical protein
MSREQVTSVYCTIFDSNYLARALVLYSSLIRVSRNARFAFFCIDERSADLLDMLQLERSIVVRHEEFSSTELAQIRPLRSQGEYCWTCKPIALLYVMARVPEADWIVYVDTDMMFFSDPDAALPGQTAHYLLTPHRFHRAFAGFERSAGKHNAGYVAARHSSIGQQAIVWWKDQCLASCSSTPTESTYADQKYLDQFAEIFPLGESSSHKGLNAAPWNIENYRISVEESLVRVDDVPLLLYHFQGLQLFDDGTASLYIGDRRLPSDLREAIYMPYVAELSRAYSAIRMLNGEFKDGLIDKRRSPGGVIARGLNILRRRRNLVRFDLSQSA